ncbi:MAG: hypothetical protein A2V70_10110 [Planctomycetes bacterium RBG_13_63_9]|nr:MAG: hypothetical protein A2V70_10110 [Planctomycetes bacterium RBG_13_63_9]
MKPERPTTETGLDMCAAAGLARHSDDRLIVPLRIASPIAVGERCQPIAVGVPLAKGSVSNFHAVVLKDHEGRTVPVQAQPLAHWSDGSVKWLLVEFLSPRLRAGVTELSMCMSRRASAAATSREVLVRELGKVVLVDTGAARFEIDCGMFRPFQSVRVGDREISGAPASRTILTDRKGRSRRPHVETVKVETCGPVRATICLSGHFPRCRGLRFRARLCFFAGTGLVRLRFAVHNPNRARHRGGLWDLGDPGSFVFRDLSLEMNLAANGTSRILWKTELEQESRPLAGDRLEIYQDSSGGENWNSRNHVNRRGEVPCRFRGYRVRTDEGEQSGRRAAPIVTWCGDAARVTVSVPEFWQQFPKAIEANREHLCTRLFPGQWADDFELQGGEQKTHTLWFRFAEGEEATADAFGWTHQPARAYLAPEWYASTGVIPHVAPASADRNDRLQTLMHRALVGNSSFFAKREVIDEYGWRNYGDVWADHEEVYYQGPKPVISHYNNQFDVVDGAIIQMMRSGDARWFEVFDPLARHVIDIDVYHTDRDKAGYNGGMFWFTDHYRGAATATHRTYSRQNAPADGQPYGGGPGSEHNFATGLLRYYYLTGDADARDTVLCLADWVIDMDDGSKNLLGVIDDGPTGLASLCGSPDYHGPGRGAANSINTLLDAWELCGRDAYLAKAEELIFRCIHPVDDLDALELLRAEKRWSYTMFLSALDRYLEMKAERGQVDRAYAYARRSLLHYADWMAHHERPYLDHPEALEYPTEAWAAQEFRKANVLRLASRHASPFQAAEMRQRAEELAERAWSDLMGFDTCTVTRALAIVMKEGPLDASFHAIQQAVAPAASEADGFGALRRFVPQKRRVLDQLKTCRGLGRMAVRLARPVAWRRLLGHLRGRDKMAHSMNHRRTQREANECEVRSCLL